jgi:hypothetical protein
MADRHTIVVRVKDGKVSEVLFCDCCPGVTLEVRRYTDSQQAAAAARPAWHMEGAGTQPSKFKRDERGVYEATYYEPDDEDS